MSTQKPKKIRLVQRQCPGDLAVMTMAIESLHRQHPHRYITGVQTYHDSIFDHHPLVTKLEDGEFIDIEMHLNRINESHIPFHFGTAYCDTLSSTLRIPLQLQVSRPSLYLSEQEQLSVLTEKTGLTGPYAVINAGYKDDYPAKWAGTDLYQSVVDAHKDRITFVQVGLDDNFSHQPKLKGVVDLINKTSIRELMRLCAGATFGVGGITAIGHFFAAFSKPYICLIGGREPLSWIGYSTQISLNTHGLLPCCYTNGCWKSKITGPTNACVLPVIDEAGCTVPTCMVMLKQAAIDAADVILDNASHPKILVNGRTLISENRLNTIRDKAKLASNMPGEMAEFGSYRGGSAKIIATAVPEKTLHVFDTFESGIPNDDTEPEGHKKGEFATSFIEVCTFLNGLNVKYHRGIFPDTVTGLDDLKFSFVHLDFDTYQSTRDALIWVWPRMVAGGIVVLDDYEWHRCPGVKLALEMVLPDVPIEKPNYMQAVIVKPDDGSFIADASFMPLLKELVVYDVPELTKRRIGSKHDGGYIIPDITLDKIDYLYSVGIGGNLDFEKMFRLHSPARFKLFDPTIQPPKMPNGSEFFAVGLGVDANPIDTLFRHYQPAPSRQRLWLKMDIEGWEWETLKLTSPHTLALFEVIVIEFHGMNDLEGLKEKVESLKKINELFTLIHAHGNNFGRHISVLGSTLPEAIEVTYVRNDLIQSAKPNEKPLPGPHDNPCRADRPDISLKGWPWVTSSPS